MEYPWSLTLDLLLWSISQSWDEKEQEDFDANVQYASQYSLTLSTRQSHWKRKKRTLTSRQLPNLPHQQSWIYQNNSILLSVAETLVSYSHKVAVNTGDFTYNACSGRYYLQHDLTSASSQAASRFRPSDCDHDTNESWLILQYLTHEDICLR